uniref:Peptidase C1A papain C-terminal domain-containing protein n=1 Tax=viral metagenome TaxID=1070528 RepID=A0A6C0BAF0_9ZZZZ
MESAASMIHDSDHKKHKTRKKRSLAESQSSDLNPMQQSNAPIVKQPSITITNQRNFKNCWNHTVSRMLCRFMFNILGISYEDTLECDRLYNLNPYSYGNKIDITILTEHATAFCQGNGYIKFLLYTFFIRFLNNKFGCETPQYTSTVLQYASPLFNTRATYSDTITAFFGEEEEGEEDRENYALQVVFNQTLHPLFLAFFQKKETANPAWTIDYFSPTFHARSLGILQKVLDRGLYISILMYLGKGQFNKSFDNYRKGQDLTRLVPRSVSKKNGHIMTIVGYTYVTSRDRVQTLLHIKNSWGRKWGIDGMFYYFLDNLGAFYTVFDWLEPSNLDALTFITRPMTISEDEFQRDYVLKYREKNAELLTAMENEEYDKFIPLIDAGADIDILDKELNISPLGIAIQTNNIELSKQLLLRDADVNETILGTMTPFLLVLINNQIEILEFMLAYDTNLDNEEYIHAIIYLCATYNESSNKEQRLVTIRTLLDHISSRKEIIHSLFIEPNLQNDVLLNSIKEGNDELIQLLLHYGADPNFERPLREKRIQKAKMLRLDSIAEILRRAGAIEDPENKEISDSLRHFAYVYNKSLNKEQTLADTRAFLDALRATKSQEEIKDILNDKDALILCSSMYKGMDPFVQLLLEYGADPNFYNENIHATCIQMAEENGLASIVEILRQAGALEDTPSPAGGKRHYYRVTRKRRATRKRRKRITRNKKKKGNKTQYK